MSLQVIQMPDPFKITVIGTGNVAFHLCKRLKTAGHPPTALVSRTPQKAIGLIRKIGLEGSTKPALSEQADFVVFAVPDQYILPTMERLSLKGNPIVLHCSGGTDLRVFRGYARQYGVLYPLQTFSGERMVDFEKIPILIEGSDPEVEEKIAQLAVILGPDVRHVVSAHRLKMHLAAVFACNFTNHLFAVAEELLSGTELNFKDLKHLIEETVEKAYDLSPGRSQTGPAFRGDMETMKKHLEMLEDADLRKLYKLHSRLIQKK